MQSKLIVAVVLLLLLAGYVASQLALIAAGLLLTGPVTVSAASGRR